MFDDFKDSALSSDYIWKCMAPIDFFVQVQLWLERMSAYCIYC